MTIYVPNWNNGSSDLFLQFANCRSRMTKKWVNRSYRSDCRWIGYQAPRQLCSTRNNKRFCRQTASIGWSCSVNVVLKGSGTFKGSRATNRHSSDRPTESDRKRPRHPTEKVLQRDDSVPCLSKKLSMMPLDRIENSARWQHLPFFIQTHWN